MCQPAKVVGAKAMRGTIFMLLLGHDSHQSLNWLQDMHHCLSASRSCIDCMRMDTACSDQLPLSLIEGCLQYSQHIRTTQGDQQQRHPPQWLRNFDKSHHSRS